MKRLIKFLLPVLVLAVGIGVFQYLKQTRPERPPAEIRERVWRVEAETVEPRRLAPSLELYGSVETPDLLRAAASAPARVARVLVREGDRVAAGQLLVELDPRDFSLRLAQAQAQVDELKAQIETERTRHASDVAALEQERKLLAIAEEGVQRAAQLTKQRVGSETDLDAAEQELARQALAVSNRNMSIADFPARQRALEARLQSARARVQEIALELERGRVAAPYEAIIAGVSVTSGDQVGKDDVLLTLYALDSLEVRARIPAPYQAELTASLRSEGALPATAAVGEHTLRLSLGRLAGEASASGIDGLFQVEGEAGLLRAGQMIALRLERPARDEVVPVPFGSVYASNRVYKLVDGRMQGVPVRSLGSWFTDTGEERLLVQAAGLAAGDRLVVSHMPNAIDGLRVETVQ
ncbi:MAG: biotin/lipoyl-binding protein [Thiocapsa sp.]|nr:biotin/lipoyl-binding protein [Thiocapsa sp.]MCG6897271.1 biotin/lipoyl-binding protein [Thiocapsa sp.]MCG6985427.1 biotin/lipoyl-binding protein [Thiocapsa sp.]